MRRFDFRAFTSAMLRRPELLISLYDREGAFDLDAQGAVAAAQAAEAIDAELWRQGVKRWSRRRQ